MRKSTVFRSPRVWRMPSRSPLCSSIRRTAGAGRWLAWAIRSMLPAPRGREREGEAAGFARWGRARVPATEDYSGSEVVILRA